jgi:LPXTG-site transpeptidase (sortase) family protein
LQPPRFDLSFLERIPRKALIAVPPVALFVVALGIALARSGGGSDQQPTMPASLGVRVGPDVAPTQAVAASTVATPVAPSAPNRASCSLIQGSDYQSSTERDWYIGNCTGSAAVAAANTTGASANTTASTAPASQPRPASAAAAPASPAVAPGSYVSGKAPGPVADRLTLTRLGVDGPVHTSVVGGDGQMGVPDGKDDIVWYDFSGFAGLGGYPGNGGNAVFAGHVDYHPHYLAVFWYLRQAVAGDVIDYYTAGGKHLQYTVDWNKNAGPDDDFSVYVGQTGSDIMTIITCDGVFNSATGHYDHRTVVRAHRTT